MDKLKKGRAPTRTAVTKACNEVNLELANTPTDTIAVKALLERLEVHGLKLSELDENIMDKMVEQNLADADIEKEQEECEEYQMKISLTRIKASQSITKPPDAGPDKKKSYKLPKTEIKKFTGEVTEWLGWWAQFQKIHADPDIDDSDKFQYLSQAMVVGSKAAEVVKVYPQTAANYPKVIKALCDRFGKEKVLKRVYVRELLKLIIKNSREKLKMSATFDQLDAHLKALESLGITPDQMDVLLYPMVESCVPEEILMAWQRSPNFGKEDKTCDPPKTEFDFLLDFIKQEVENEGQRKIAKEGFGAGSKEKEKPKYQERNDVPTAASLLNSQKSVGCIFCGKTNHASPVCFKAKNLSLELRKEVVRKKGVCFKCLKSGHRAKFCKESPKCTTCNKDHVLVMCPGSMKTSEDEELAECMARIKTSTNSNQVDKLGRVLMKTLHCRAKGPDGEVVNVRLMFDEGSERSYIKTDVAKLLKCNPLDRILLQNNLFGGEVSKPKICNFYEVTLEGINSKESRNLKLINEDVICNSCPTVPPGPWIKELAKKKIYLTDTWADSPEIEILIGSNHWGKLMTGKMFRLKNGLIAVESVLGWTLSGEIPSQINSSCATTVISMLTKGEHSIQDMWSLDTLGIRDTAEQISEGEHNDKVKKSLQESVSRDKDGRYAVKLPWIDQPMDLPHNRDVAEIRLMKATDKLEKQGGLEEYGEVFQGWEKEGIIEEVRSKSDRMDVRTDLISGRFLPHRPVFKPDNLTTPIRPVFDASCRVGNNPSLNQCLEKGPNMLELIPSILHRFREKKIGAVADIRKAFQMVGVVDNDKNFQKFLWWEDYSKKILKEYRHCRVVFGLNCSPFILAAVLDLHLSQVTENREPVAELLKKSLYVDNVVTSLDNEDQYKTFKEKSIAIFDEAKMDLRQWESNLDDSGGVTSVLGLEWRKDEDTLSCRVPDLNLEEMKVSKRKVLSLVSQVFDPIGFLCPALLQPKIMIQDSWAVEKDWDKEWSQDETEKFLRWVGELAELKKIRIPRYAFGDSSRKGIQIHQFCDASRDAYAAIVFVRVELIEGVSVQLIQARSRVAPLSKKKQRTVTIPRLELMGCLIGSRLTQSVKESLAIEEVPTFYWSDSTTALAWIERDEDWGTFVGNRVREINRLTKKEEWRFVPGTMNPADLPSRGCSPSQLVHSRWWGGPQWLKDREENWPKSVVAVDEETVLSELKKSVTNLVSLTEETFEP